jgi:hypothetical protein
MKILITIPLLLITLVSCEKTDMYRVSNGIGEYNFTIEKEHRSFENGMFYTTYDTTFYEGSVRKIQNFPYTIRAEWGSGTIRIESGQNIDQNNTVMLVDEQGNLHCDVSDGFLRPAYIRGDTIRFGFYGGGGMAHHLYTHWKVTGIKHR